MPILLNSYDRLLVVIGTVAAMVIVGSTALTLQKFNEGQTVVVPKRSDALPKVSLAKVELASARLSDPVLWSGKHLFVSEPVFLQAGELRPFESELPDAWLTQYAFAKTDPLIDTRDPDKDLFTNLEEWQGKTDPTSPDSHPPAMMKVSLMAMIASDLELVFRGRVDSKTWQIDLASKAAFHPQNCLPALGERFGPDKRFRLDLYEENWETDAQGILHDRSVAKISYVETGRAARATALLVQGRAWEMPTHTARFFNPYKASEFTARRGEKVRLDADPEIEYTLMRVTEEEAVFRDQEGREFQVRPK